MYRCYINVFIYIYIYIYICTLELPYNKLHYKASSDVTWSDPRVPSTFGLIITQLIYYTVIW